MRLVFAMPIQYPNSTLFSGKARLRAEAHVYRGRGGIRAALGLVAFLATISFPALAAVVNFPDPGLEAAIRDAIAKPTGDIHDTDLVGLTYLTANDRGISNLEGIQHCTDLTELSLDDNQIVDISPLSGLTTLTELDLYGNQIVDISSLSGLTTLTKLVLDGNHIADISPLSGLTTLTELVLDGNHIADISPLSGLTNLTQLGLNRNQIVDISPLSGLTNLTVLELDGNQIVDISPLSGLTNLTELDLYGNQIADITPLVSNAGIDSGDDADVRWNHLDLTPGSANMQDINTLLGRGVSLQYDPQKSAAVFRVDDSGNVLANQAFHAATFETGAADIAECVRVSEPVEPGDVLELDPDAFSTYRLSRTTCSSFVAGVVSTEPGVVLGETETLGQRVLLALIGIVPVKVTNEGGSIQPGDLLVTSSTPGHAMRWAGEGPCPCALVGKALEPMTDETGVILVLLTAH